MKIEKFCKEIERILRENTSAGTRLSFSISYDVYEFDDYQRMLNISILTDTKTNIREERTKDFFKKKFKNEKQALKALKACFVPVPKTENVEFVEVFSKVE